MLAHVLSCGVIGLDGVIIDIEVDFGQGLPHMAIVGLPDEAVKESRERVYSAIKNANLAYPRKPITVNLAPASVRKEGPSFDLPIAVGVLIAGEQINQEEIEGALVVGELVAPGGVLEHRRAAEGKDELDIVVPVRPRHRRHGGEPAGEAEHLVQRRNGRRAAREDPGRIAIHRGSMPGSDCSTVLA